MAKVTVYRFKKWNIQRDEFDYSTRMGTLEAIRDVVCGAPVEGSGIEIDEALIGREYPGLTDRDFKPD